MEFVEPDPVVVLATSVTATTRVFTMADDATVSVRAVAAQLPGVLLLVDPGLLREN